MRCRKTFAVALVVAAAEQAAQHYLRARRQNRGATAPLLLPGITVNTSATDFAMVESMQLARFDGTRWVRFGEVMGK